MKTLNTQRLSMVITLALASACAHAAGFQHGFAADPDGKPLEIGIWYPSSAAVQPVAMGPTTMSVAVKGPVQGKALPLVLMSHGTGGSFLGHVDTAIALADAGFVVAAVTHTGDNYADQSRSVDIMDRPRPRAAARWPRSRPPFAPVRQVLIGSDFTRASTQRSLAFSARHCERIEAVPCAKKKGCHPARLHPYGQAAANSATAGGATW